MRVEFTHHNARNNVFRHELHAGNACLEFVVRVVGILVRAIAPLTALATWLAVQIGRRNAADQMLRNGASNGMISGLGLASRIIIAVVELAGQSNGSGTHRAFAHIGYQWLEVEC